MLALLALGRPYVPLCLRIGVIHEVLAGNTQGKRDEYYGAADAPNSKDRLCKPRRPFVSSADEKEREEEHAEHAEYDRGNHEYPRSHALHTHGTDRTGAPGIRAAMGGDSVQVSEIDETTVREGEPSSAEIERPEVVIEVHMQPLAPRRLR